MEFGTDYIAESLKSSYSREGFKDLKGKKVLFLCAEYKDRVESNFENFYKFIPIRYCIISSASSSNGNLWVRLKLDNFVFLKNNLSIENFSKNIKNEVGDINLPCWYKCGPGKDQTKFKVATIGNDNYIIENETEEKLHVWERLIKLILKLVQNARKYIFYYVDGLFRFNSNENLLIYSDKLTKKSFKLKPNTRYTLKLRTYGTNEEKFFTQLPYLKFTESRYLSSSDMKEVRMDSIRATPVILNVSTIGKQIKKKKGTQISIEFGPKISQLMALKIKIPFYIFKMSSIVLFIIFLLFLSINIVSDSILAFTEILDTNSRIIWYAFSTLGNIVYLLLLYRKRI